MRAYNGGCYVHVTASKDDVDAFADRWPCFGPIRAIGATFDRRNGDLVDIHGNRDMDDIGVGALLEDMKAYARKRALLGE